MTVAAGLAFLASPGKAADTSPVSEGDRVARLRFGTTALLWPVFSLLRITADRSNNGLFGAGVGLHGGAQFGETWGALLELQGTAQLGTVEGNIGILFKGSLTPLVTENVGPVFLAAGPTWGHYLYDGIIGARNRPYFGGTARVGYRTADLDAEKEGRRSHVSLVWFEVRAEWSKARLDDGRLSPAFAATATWGVGYDSW